MHDYGLSWIDNEKLYNVTKDTLVSSFKKQKEEFDPYNNKNVIDPVSAVFHMFVLGLDFEEWESYERLRQVGKTLQNAIGNWHQKVLGLAKNWEDKGTKGVYDLESKTKLTGFEPKPENPKIVIAEVKNKFNTIKGDTQHNYHEKLREQIGSREKDATAYLIQIVPKNKERYNKPWVPPNSKENIYIRHIDGHSAYDLLFSHPGALKELYDALPNILSDIVSELDPKDFNISRSDIEKLSKLFASTY